jgi:hypothetical protein
MWCRRWESNDTPLLITRNLLKKHDRSKRNNRPMPHSDVQNHVQRKWVAAALLIDSGALELTGKMT